MVRGDDAGCVLPQLVELCGRVAKGDSDSRPRDCVICKDNKSTMVIVPCGHVCLCSECHEAYSNNLSTCPLDHLPIETIVKVYFS